MGKVVLITGANGTLAQFLAKELGNEYSIRFLTRKVKKNNEYLWDIRQGFIDPKALKGVHHIIHLAGSSIADKRWTDSRKKLIHSSRVDSSQLILKELKKQGLTIESFISASAIGYYGTSINDITFDENSPKGQDFLSDVCQDWENAAQSFKSEKIARNVSIVRVGIILSSNSGVLKKMSQPIRLGIGSGLGTGKQWIPWIHIRDLSRIFKFLVDKENINGTFNAVAPEYTTNMELTRGIAKVLNRRLILPNIPGFIIKLLFGEMSVVLLKGNKVSSKKIEKSGFVFEFKKIDKALNNLFKGN